MVVLLILLGLASLSDMLWYKIPNVIILVGICAGLYLTDVRNVFHAGLIFLLMYPFFLMRGIGAGDIKLMMMTACFMNQENFIKCLMISMGIAGVIAITKMAINKESRSRLLYLGGYLRKVVVTRSIDEYEVDKSQKKAVIRLSVPMFLGALITVWQMGGLYVF